MVTTNLLAMPGMRPLGVEVEAIEGGARVTLEAQRVRWRDRRVLLEGALSAGIAAVVGAVLFAAKGAFRTHPLVALMAIMAMVPVGGLRRIVRVRMRIGRRLSQAAVLRLADGKLTIDDVIVFVGRSYAPGREHMEYAVADLSRVEKSSWSNSLLGAWAFDGSLSVELANGTKNYHLVSRDAAQIEWVAEWLTMELRRRQHGGKT